ncbi:MAG: hypothetical protein ACRDVP_01225 [Acidimicrobiales bacterium]
MGLVTFAPAAAALFGVVFAVFVLATVILAVIAVRWAVRRDRIGRREWKRRQLEAATERSELEQDKRNRPAP